MATSLRKKIFLIIFCLASITQGMYSTYFVSILTTIERIYQIQSKTVGAILSATEIGQILGSLLIAYYGGKGNRPKWISACMTLSALAALISISPQFLILTSSNDSNQATATIGLIDPLSTTPLTSSSSPYTTNDLTTESTPTTSFMAQSRFEITSLCHIENFTDPTVLKSTHALTAGVIDSVVTSIHDHGTRQQTAPFGLILVIFFICLLAIGFGSTAITTLGIPFIDDIVSKEESPLYLGLTIGLKIFGPALGFLLGSFCINLDLNITSLSNIFGGESHSSGPQSSFSPMVDAHVGVGAWWLGLIIISLPLLLLAFPMYYLSRMIECNDSQKDDFEDITYQAAEDHDIGGSHDFQSHMLGLEGIGGELGDITSNRTCFSSEIDSSSCEVLQSHNSPTHHRYHQYNNYGKNITLEQPILSTSDFNKTKLTGMNAANSVDELPSAANNNDNDNNNWRSSGICVVVNHFGGLESTNFTNDEATSFHSRSPCAPSSSRSSVVSSAPSYSNNTKQQQPQQSTIADLSGTLSRLIKNKLLLLRMLSGILHILPIAGFYTFFPKYLIEQFRITSSSASAISGLAGILFVGFGAFLGGTIVRLFNVNSRLMTRWIASSALLYTLGMIILMNLGCTNNQTVYYGSVDFMSTDCLTLCKCSNAIYNPVCANGTTYMSPCLAGCRSYTISGGKVIFDECGCSLDTSSLLANATEPLNKQRPIVDDRINLNVATQGHCLIDCDNLKWYIIIFSISTLIHASCEVGSIMFNLRCVNSDDRTLALGLTTFSSSLLGTIPCSVIYGTIVDLTCVYWDSVAPPIGSDSIEPSRGACQAYENDSFRYYLHGVTALVMFLAFIVDCIISRRANEVDFYDGNDSRTDIRMELKKSTETI